MLEQPGIDVDDFINKVTEAVFGSNMVELENGCGTFLEINSRNSIWCKGKMEAQINLVDGHSSIVFYEPISGDTLFHFKAGRC